MLAAVSLAVPESNWSTANSRLSYKGEYDTQEVVLHGFGTTCSEYLLRGIGMKCWATYDWSDPKNIITNLNDAQINAMLEYLY